MYIFTEMYLENEYVCHGDFRNVYICGNISTI